MRRGALSETFGLRLLLKPQVQRMFLIVLLTVLLVIRVLQFFYFTHEIQWGYDLEAYDRSARQLIADGTVYEPFQLEGTYSPQSQPYVYPPFLAVLVVPLATVFDDYRDANWLWAALGALVLAVTVVAIARREQVARGPGLVVLVAAAFAYAPVIGELIIGNVHLLILGLLAAAWLAVSRNTPRSEVAAGVMVGIAALIKVFPGLMIVWFLVTGRLRAALAAGLVMVALAALTLPVTGIGPWLEYPTVLLNLGPPNELANALAPTVWLSEIMPRLIARALVTVAGVAIVVWVARRRSAAISFGVAVAVSVLIAPALYPHYLAILVLPMLLALRHASPALWLLPVYLSASNAWPEGIGDAILINRVLMTGGAIALAAGLIWFGRERVAPSRANPSP